MSWTRLSGCRQEVRSGAREKSSVYRGEYAQGETEECP